MLEHIQQSLDTIAEKDRKRDLRKTKLLGAGRLCRDRRVPIDFSSNDYLGLANHPYLIECICKSICNFGAGSGGSRLITGNRAEHLAVEVKIAKFKNTEASLVFATGWQANAGVIPALAKAAPSTAIFADRLVHNSIYAGMRS